MGPKGQEPDKSRVRIMSAMEGYAYDSDVRPGDHLIRVDGRPVDGRTLQEVTDLLRGQAGLLSDRPPPPCSPALLPWDGGRCACGAPAVCAARRQAAA